MKKTSMAFIVAAMACGAPYLSAFGQSAAGKTAFQGNTCTHSSGGTFVSDVDGGIGNSSTTAAMIVHCPINIDAGAYGFAYVHDQHTSQDIVCTIQFRQVIPSGTGFTLVASTLATGQSTGTTGESGYPYQVVDLGPNRFTATALGWAFMRCVIPPATTPGPSIIKGYYFSNFGN